MKLFIKKNRGPFDGGKKKEPHIIVKVMPLAYHGLYKALN